MSYSLTTKMSWAATQQALGVTFDKWGITEWDTNYPKGSRLSGFYQSDEDRTVILRWKSEEGRQVSLEMGTQSRAVDNLRVLYLAVEAMRMNEKRGISEILESAYKQLSGAVASQTPYEVLGIMPDTPIDVAEAVYRAKAKIAHPDQGGSEEQMKILSKAIEDIRGGVLKNG